MFNKITTFIGVLFVTSIASIAHGANTETNAISQTIMQSYFQGAYNALDTVAMAKGFHEEFAILGADGENLERFTIKDWITSIEKRKAQPGFDMTSAKRDCKIIQIDGTNGVGSAKVEIYKDGKILYTDYLSLIKFASGWKIVSKVYAEHSH